MKSLYRKMFAFGILFSILPVFAAEGITRNVLVLNSYSPEYQWTQDQYSGIMDMLKTTGNDCVVYTEYLDWKRFPNETHVRQFFSLCRDKYPKTKIDLIITTDDRALQFAVENRAELFSDAPIVFSGVYRDSLSALSLGRKRITGVFEDLDVTNTLRFALRIHPEIKYVYLINEMTESGRGTELLMVDASRALMPYAEIVSLSDRSIEEIELFVKDVPPDSLVLVGSYFIEKGGRSFTTEILAQRVSRASAVPLYTVFSHVFGSGVLGGSMLSGSMMGKHAGALALQILSGESVDSLPPVGGSGFVTMFDYTVVKRFRIPLSALPSDTVFINRKPPFFKTYRIESFSLFVIILLLSLFLIAVWYMYKKTEHIAFYDQMTGLTNKAAAFKTGNKLLSLNDSGKTAALLYIDIDNFKYFNDTFGHEFGDKILVRLAAVLRAEIGKNVRVSHFGGDEFLVLILNSRADKIIAQTQVILGRLGRMMTIDGNRLFLTFSTGVALYPEHALQFSELIQNADTAMHKAKTLGNGRFIVYDETMYRALKKRMEIENGLRSAVENGEMYIVYQGQINLQTGRLDGLEALLRWKHPEYGMISPADFIPIAEGTGQIETIGLFVFTGAVRFIRQAEIGGHTHFSVSINVSVRQMHSRDFVGRFIGIIREEGVSANRITIEVTESVLMEDVEEIRLKLEQLREAGFRIALDDFGTGYSSLTYLRYLPINYIKMDKSFIDDMFVDDRSRELTGSIIRICHDLGLKCIAEGVESAGQMAFLKQKNCDLIQGYYFSKPVAEDIAMELLGRKFMQ